MSTDEKGPVACDNDRDQHPNCTEARIPDQPAYPQVAVDDDDDGFAWQHASRSLDGTVAGLFFDRPVSRLIPARYVPPTAEGDDT
jgi:hypothetical protein